MIRVGVIGGGQLARMMLPPALNLGLDIRVLAESEGSPARLGATAIGDYQDIQTVLDFASSVDIITFDHEHVPQAILHALVDSGVAVHPGPQALQFTQDKLDMRERLSELGIPSPDWARVENTAQLDHFLSEHGGAGVLKTPRGGYDGKGVRVVRSAAEAEDWFAAVAESGTMSALLVEELIDFRRELAQLGARSATGELRFWDIAETVQRDGVCSEVIAPAPGATAPLREEALSIARALAEGLEITGTFAVELFETTDGRLLVNEMAMRPHNSGHWTQDGARTSQFEQHLRAVAGLPLGDTTALAPVTVMANILGGPLEGSLSDRYAAAMEFSPEAKIHNYDKAPRPGRKVGHINVSGENSDEVRARARAVETLFQD